MRYQDFDLFGEPVSSRRERRGRPPHLPTPELRLKVMELRGDGCSQERIARAIGISVPTLLLNYFAELGSRSLAWRRREEIDDADRS